MIANNSNIYSSSYLWLQYDATFNNSYIRIIDDNPNIIYVNNEVLYPQVGDISIIQLASIPKVNINMLSLFFSLKIRINEIIENTK